MQRLCALLLPAIFAAVACADDPKPHIVMLIAEREYNTDRTLPEFAAGQLADFRVTFVYADPQDRNRLEGIEAVDDADVLVVSVRRRTLPEQQLQVIRQYVQAGKPVIGIRTANHAFCLRGKEAEQGRAQWKSWDQDVFGGNYTNHYGNKLKTSYRVADGALGDLIKGIAPDESFTAGGSLYKVAPLAKGAQTVLIGSVPGQPPEPLAWTFTRTDGGKSFYTSLGHEDDFKGDVLPKLLTSAINWALATSTSVGRDELGNPKR